MCIRDRIASGTGTPSHGGFYYYEVLELIDGIIKQGSVVGLDLVEVAPDYDLTNSTSTLAAQLLMNVIGRILYNRLNFSNSYFVHRDYHVQNLMSVGKTIGIIDSQDALIGNPAYDLVSLVDDVRIKTSMRLKNQAYNYYLKKIFKIRKINKEKF